MSPDAISLPHRLANPDPDLALPARLRTAGQELELRSLLRHLSGRRAVYDARLDQRPVIAKLYTGHPRSRRDFEHECTGLRRLAAAGLPAPALLLAQDDDAGRLLLMERLVGRSGRTVFPLARPADPDLFVSLLRLLRDMWQHGVLQQDIHLDNFLLPDAGGWQLLDVGGMTFADDPVPASKAAPNLALLMAQFPPQFARPLWDMAARTLDRSLVARAERLAPRIRRKRLRRIVSKTMRDCTEFATGVHCGHRMWLRRDRRDAVQALLDAGLDRLMESGHILKDGNSTTVALVQVAGQRYVIKRYNLKNLRKRVTRQFSSHARQAWQGGAFLAALGLATPLPVLYLSERAGPFVGREYLVTEFAEGDSLPDVFAPTGAVPEKPALEIARFFHAMRLAGFSHGDTKWTNFLFTKEHDLIVMDLDGMSLWPRRNLRGAHAAQRQRFLRNWPFSGQRMHEIDQAIALAERKLEMKT